MSAMSSHWTPDELATSGHHRGCPACRGAGHTAAHLMATPQMIYAMAAIPSMADAEVPVFRERCRVCDGSGSVMRT